MKMLILVCGGSFPYRARISVTCFSNLSFGLFNIFRSRWQKNNNNNLEDLCLIWSLVRFWLCNKHRFVQTKNITFLFCFFESNSTLILTMCFKHTVLVLFSFDVIITLYNLPSWKCLHEVNCEVILKPLI